MKKLNAISFAILSLGFAASAHAWPKCPDGSISLLNEAGKYVCPSPTPGGQPITVTDTVNANPSSDADAAAKAEAEAKAAAAAIAAALANGGNATGGDAKAISDNWNKLSTEQQQKLIASLSQDQRQALTSTLNNATTANGGAGGNAAGGSASLGAGAGAAQVSTTNISNSSARTLVLAPITAQAPSLPHQMGNFTVQDGLCSPALNYKSFGMPIVHRRAFLPDTVIDMDTGLMVVDNAKEKQDWTVLGESEDGKFRVVQGEIARQVVGLNSVSGSDGLSIQFGNGNGAGGVGSSGGKANQFMAGYFMQPSVCYVKQTKLGKGWIPSDMIIVTGSSTATTSGPTAEDVLAALAKARILLNVPTTTLVRDNTPCKMETFTDSAGKPVTMCRGPQGSFQTTRVVPGSVPVTGTLELGVAGKK
jgi:hypothetical protein